MTAFNLAETAACRRLIDIALEEDLGPAISTDGDITSARLIDPATDGAATLVARQAGVLAGMPAATMVFGQLDPTLELAVHIPDGTVLQPGSRIATVAGPMTSILAAERTALNFLQHLSGIATLTSRYVQEVAGLPVKILDTRKTIPGWRLLAKYAVRQGGGHNHRFGLFDMLLIKDNHWAAMHHPYRQEDCFYDWLDAEFERLHQHDPGIPIEIEIESLFEFDRALEGLLARPDIILLDNMPVETMREAVKRRNQVAPGIQLEASGGVTLETVRAIAETGVDRISVGALTHSAPALDVALDYTS